MVVRAGEDYTDMKYREARENGHAVRLRWKSPCVRVPTCLLCRKTGWNNLEGRCGG